METMVGNPYRWRASIPQLENRNATAGCLLTLLFVVPYVAKYGQVGVIPLSVVVLIYVGLVVPLMTGILTKRTLILFFRNFSGFFSVERWSDIVTFCWFVLEWSHYLYMNVESIHLTTMHIIFNLATEKWLCPDQRFCSLYVLLFYLVLAYLRKSLESRPWTQLPSSESSTAEFIKLTTAFMIVRLGKGVVMTLVLLTFSMQFESMEPSASYVAVTFLYFCLTQYQKDPVVLKTLSDWLSKLRLQWLEGMEELWLPLFANLVTLGLASTVGVFCILNTKAYFIILIYCYTNIISPAIHMIHTSWIPLREERRKISQFPLASWKNPEIRSGGLCAICLDKLTIFSSRVTKCGHVFHSSCLRTGLNYSSRCPLCKTIL